nr:MAG TPA: hypothetical protein [Caudoviricetes sp.]
MLCLALILRGSSSTRSAGLGGDVNQVQIVVTIVRAINDDIFLRGPAIIVGIVDDLASGALDGLVQRHAVIGYDLADRGVGGGVDKLFHDIFLSAAVRLPCPLICLYNTTHCVVCQGGKLKNEK